MRPTLQYVTTIEHPTTGYVWVLAAPIGGGTVEALTVSTANTGANEGWLEGWPPADRAPAPERSGTEQFGLSAQEITELAFSVAGAASSPFMRDHPDYVFPAEEIGEMVRELLRERFGFDAASIEGYRGLAESGHHEGLEQARQTKPEG